MSDFLSARVTSAELAHLETRRPDEGHSGYKSVFKATHGTGWRVRLKVGGKLRSLKGIHPSPREAASALVRFYRERYGASWTTLTRPAWYIPEPPPDRPWHVPAAQCRDPRKYPTSAGYCPELARLPRRRVRLRPVEADGYRIFEQDPGEWVITAVELGHTVYADQPGRKSFFATRESALIFLGMWQRRRWPMLGLRILGERRKSPKLPPRNAMPRHVLPLSFPTVRPKWRRLPDVWRVTLPLPFPT